VSKSFFEQQHHGHENQGTGRAGPPAPGQGQGLADNEKQRQTDQTPNAAQGVATYNNSSRVVNPFNDELRDERFRPAFDRIASSTSTIPPGPPWPESPSVPRHAPTPGTAAQPRSSRKQSKKQDFSSA
jgi:hypothetical protein